MMFNQTVTIYNRHGNDNPARWGRRVLRGVYWRSGVGTSLSVTGVTGGQLECLLILPQREGYVTPAAYAAAESHDDMQAIYTAIQFSGESITSVRLSAHTIYKIAGGKLSLYGRR